MKCALELLTIREVAIENWKREEKIKDMEAMAKQEEIVSKTIEFCDTVINDKLVSLAEARRNYIGYTLGKIKIFEDRLGNTHFHFLEKGFTRYADGRYSEIEGFETYDFYTLKDYLFNHCIEVKEEDSVYYVYGSGGHACKRITIEVPKSKE